ncbi:hypothetical protein [Paenibacillus apii]|uniref:hypothetical protein n=1 Tax=Paenibacillus apii TaxID=1850370 RepID=UPI00143C8413|nr:hypothetical protein [Paenibacillus apii]NJJ40727.1 hypothetical protein [Paenibacillus apii]
MKLGYDKKENANGDLIFTTLSSGNEFPQEKFIHFNKSEWISLKDMHDAIKKNRESQSIMPMAADLPYIKAYKYGDYIFSNVQWNSNNLSVGDNNLQIKFKPVWGNLMYWTDPYGNQGTLIKNQSEIFTVLTRYESYVTTSPYSIVYTYPIVKETTQQNIPITISYAGIGSEIQIPVGSTNTKTDGNPARWDLNDISIPLQDNYGRDLDEYAIQGVQKAQASGSNVKIQTGVYVKVGAFYYFGSKPAQWTTFTDSYNHDNIYAKVQ